jgi:hypothetical protein
MAKITIELDTSKGPDYLLFEKLNTERPQESEDLYLLSLNLVKQAISLKEKFIKRSENSIDSRLPVCGNNVLKLDIGRCTFKTSIIKELITEKDVIIVNNPTIRNFLYNGIKRVFTSEEVIRDRLRGCKFDKIFIDDSSFMDKNIKEMMYRELRLFQHSMIIELG